MKCAYLSGNWLQCNQLPDIHTGDIIVKLGKTNQSQLIYCTCDFILSFEQKIIALILTFVSELHVLIIVLV